MATKKRKPAKSIINSGVLESVSADLKAKLAAHARNFIRTLPDL
jgi:hypothetical protein